MIDFREVLIPYIKSKLSNIDVRDGSSTFEQPIDNYVTYYILSEIVASFQNETITNTATEEATYTPLNSRLIKIHVYKRVIYLHLLSVMTIHLLK